MKKVNVIMLVLAFVATAASGQVCTPPKPIDMKAAIGRWQGNYTQNGEIKSLQIEIREVNQKLVSYVDMPGFGLRNTSFETKVCESQEFHMKKTDAGKLSLEFVGKTKSENKMSGRLSIKKGDQDMVEEIFTLTKVGGEMTSAK